MAPAWFSFFVLGQPMRMKGTIVSGIGVATKTMVASHLPTNKWWAAQVVAIGALLTLWVTTGHWATDESVALIGLVVQAVTTYLVPNSPTPGGVPEKKA
jgi:hypothetical protein